MSRFTRIYSQISNLSSTQKYSLMGSLIGSGVFFSNVTSVTKDDIKSAIQAEKEKHHLVAPRNGK